MTQGCVLITGAGSGIGAATANLFSQKGYKIILVGRREEALKNTAELCTTETKIIPCDITQPQVVENLANSVIATEWLKSERRILINNAGLYKRSKFAKTDLTHWESTFQTNLFGPVHLTQLLWNSLQNGGVIINVSSTLGLRPMPTASAYSASKAAMNNWSQCLALEGARVGIRVNTICPGIVNTPIHDFFHKTGEEKETLLEQANKSQPLGRIGRPEELAQSIYFLATPDSSWTTGAILAVDGGINL